MNKVQPISKISGSDKKDQSPALIVIDGIPWWSSSGRSKDEKCVLQMFNFTKPLPVASRGRIALLPSSIISSYDEKAKAELQR